MAKVTKAPDERQKKVLKNIVEKRGSMRQAMIDAGYSVQYAKNPKQFRETKSWQELLEEHLPDWLLLETHEELLGSDDENIQLRATDLGYKLKGRHAPEKHEHKIEGVEIVNYGKPKQE